MVDQRILPMSTIHLPHMGAELICFWPIMLSRFAMKVSDARHVSSAKPIQAIFLVALNVKCGNTPTGVANEIDYIFEMFVKTLCYMHGILALAVVRINARNVGGLGTKSFVRLIW